MHTDIFETVLRDVALPPTRSLDEKLRTICLPAKLEFVRVSFFDAVSFLRQEGCRRDVEEADELARGVPVWIGVEEGAPLLLGEPGESRVLDQWLGRMTITASFEESVCLGTAWQDLAFTFGLEMRVHEESGALILRVPTVCPRERLRSTALERIKAAVARAKALLEQAGSGVTNSTHGIQMAR